MFSLGSEHRYFLYKGACDMRKGFGGLAGLVSNELGRSPTDGSVFVFINRPKTQMKLLHWEAGGLVLYQKRLESGRFNLPKITETEGQLSWPELVMMVEGIQYFGIKKQRRFSLKNV